jgi:PAS domain S-box-containing protein
MPRTLQALICLFAFGLLLRPFPAQARTAEHLSPATGRHNRVLILYSYNNNLPSQQCLTLGIEKARKAARLSSGDFQHEYLDISADPEERHLLRRLLLKKYKDKHFDLIVTVYEPALDFLLTDGRDLSPETPCLSIFCLERPGLERAGQKVIQFPLHFDLTGTLALAIKLFPGTDRVILALGTSKADVVFEKRARSELAAWKDRLTIEYTSDRSVEQLLKEVRHLPRSTLVITSRIEEDTTGATFVPRDVTSMIAKASPAPVFCLVSAQLDTGAVGGSLVDFEEVGAMLSREVVNLATGKPMTGAPSDPHTRPMFNWEQIKRWDVNPILLPANSLIINRPNTLWNQHKRTVVVSVFAFLVLIAFIITLLMEIRRRAKAEESAMNSESRFRVLFDHAPDAIVVYDYNHDIIVDANTGAEKLFGCSRAQLMQKGLLCFYPDNQPDGRDATVSSHEHFDRALKEKSLRFERTIQRQDGARLICDVHLVQLPSRRGRLIRASYIDITERKIAEEALRLEKERYQSILKTAMNGFCLLDKDGRFLEVNDMYCMMSGYSVEDLKNMAIFDLEDPEHPNNLKAHIKTIIKKRKARFETRHRHKDGYFVDVEASVSYEPSGDGRFVAFIRDITERKQAEAQRKELENQLHQAQKMEVLGTLAGGIAHDFNNILYPIMGFTEMLLDTVPEDSDFKQSLQQILKASLRAADLVQQILTFSRQSETELVPVKIQLIIKDALKLMRASLPATISIHPDINKKCGMVLASPTHIHQIAMNLMTNAFHAMEDKGGTLSVSLSEVMITIEDIKDLDVYPGRYALYSVADTGHGIEKHILEKIFDPYFTTKQAGKGTGLGLAVVHGIVKSYGGDIRVSSEPGHGAVFDVYLPVMDSADLVNAMSKDPLQVSGGNEHILLVDDEETILRMERKMLERLGYRVTTRTNSVEALELFRGASDEFDLVITDMTMPDMTGEAFAAELKKIRKEIPVILCTGFSSKISLGTAEALGVESFLMKPVVKGELLKTIRTLLDGKREH